MFAWEQHNIFSSWTCVGHAADLAEPGSQRAVSVGAGSVVLSRDEDGTIHAFANACRHRGHELLQCGETAKRRSIICPYHSWSYKLDGSLRNAPSFRDVPGFEPDRFGLVELRVVDWHGWIFVDPTGTGGEFADHVAGTEEIIAPYRPEDLVDRRAAQLRARVQLEGDRRELPGVLPLLDDPSGTVAHQPADERRQPRAAPAQWMGGSMDLIPEAATMSLDGRSGGVAIAGLSETELRSVMYLVGYPNLLVSLHPDYVMTHLMTPLSVDRTHVECAWAFPRDGRRARRASTRPTPSTSGTSPTGRTGRRASPCSAV